MSTQAKHIGGIVVVALCVGLMAYFKDSSWVYAPGAVAILTALLTDLRKAAGLAVLALLLAFSGCGITGPVPPPGAPGIVNCSDTALHQAELNILPNVESALASASWEQALLTVVAGIAGPLALSEVDCVVAYVENKAALASTATADSIEATKVSNARSWLAKHPANITGMAPVAP